MHFRASTANSEGDMAEEIYNYINDNDVGRSDLDNNLPKSDAIGRPPRNDDLSGQPTAEVVDRSKPAKPNCIRKCVAVSFCFQLVLTVVSVTLAISLHQMNKKIGCCNEKSSCYVNESGE